MSNQETAFTASFDNSDTKMKKNLFLVQVVDSYGPNKFLPLAISYQWLAASQNPTVSNQWQVCDVLIEKLNIAQWIQAITQPPDMVAMSCYVWNWEYNQALAYQIKQKWPDCAVVVGGPQVSKHDADLVRNNLWMDIAVLGENESAFELILSGADPSTINGVITQVTTEITQPERTTDLDVLPSPILTGFYDWIIDQYHKRYSKDVMWQVTYETMRGCPYHCQFCDIGDSYWNKTYFYDIERIKKEIEWMGQRKIEYVSVCDSNWGIVDRDVEITQCVIDTKIKYGYPQFWDVTWAKSNTDRVKKIAFMDHQAGTRLFKGITFAFQSFTPSTLASVKRFNLQDAAVKSSLQLYQKNNIPTYSELIWPMPNETLVSLKQNIQNLVSLGQRDFIMVHPLVLTPNSDMSNAEYRSKYNLQTRRVCLDTFWLKIDNPDNYIREQIDTVYATNTATYQDVIDGNMFAYWFIVLYYYGWANAVIEYLSKTYSMTHVEVVDNFIKWAQSQTQGLMHREHYATKQGLLEVYENSAPWGRQLEIDGVYWEYKSATSVNFHHNRQQVTEELAQWIKDRYNLDFPELLELNSDLCHDWRRQYPMKKFYNPNTVKTVLGIDSDFVKFDHWDQTITSDREFCNVAYHYQRKNRYWRCSITASE